MSCVHGNLPKKIHGGITVEIIEHPHQVSIQIQNYHLCGGVIISEEHILTTASCVSADVGLEKKMRFHIRQRSATWPPKYPQSRLFVTGWGTNSEMNVMKNYLQLVKVKSISSRICKVRYYTEGTLTGNQYCLFPRPPLARITWGNSGSPVTIGTGVVGLISVVSLDHKLPTTYSRVYNYMYWIQKNVEKLNSKLHY
ncbi:trypsin-like [Aphidius gifuensis]|uniref:trypsin-like n=1 Tax=Aphidius gifuensis TaxID=684658 RepID=UPI001CDB6C01|nr:trypsin-like [Aphidius gifuensis]